MSSVDDTDSRRTLTRRLNEGLNPENMPTDRLRQYIPGDVDDESAGRVHNPHEWSDPERTWRERLFPQTTAKQILATAAAVCILGIAFYAWPIVGPVFQSPTILVLAALVASYLVVWLHGNQAGMRRYKKLDKWVRVKGDDAEVAAVERLDDDTDDDLPLFKTIDRLSYGGFNKAYLARRQLPFKTSRLKRYPDDDGMEPVTDAGNPWTYSVETDTLGTFHVTDTAGLAWARGMDSAERYCRPPEKLDQEQWDRSARLIDELQRQIRNLRDELEMVREHVESTTDLRDELRIPEIEGTVRLMQELQDATDRGYAPRRRERTEDSTPIAAPLPQSYHHRDDGGDDE